MAQELIILLIAGVSIGGVAAFVGPRILRAAADGDASAVIADEVALGLKGLIEAASEVLAVQRDPLTGDTFIVLWGGDPNEHGVINRGEIIVLHHSNARQILSAWVCAKPKDLFGGIGEEPVDTRSRRISRAVCEAEDFGSEWVQSADVERKVIGTGVRSFRFHRESTRNQRGVFRIALTRASSETDGQEAELEFEACAGAASPLGT